MAFILGQAFADILVLVLQCRPITGSWTIMAPMETDLHSCMKKDTYYIMHGILTTFTTMCTILASVMVLRHVSMTKVQRRCLTWILLSSVR